MPKLGKGMQVKQKMGKPKKKRKAPSKKAVGYQAGSFGVPQRRSTAGDLLKDLNKKTGMAKGLDDLQKRRQKGMEAAVYGQKTLGGMGKTGNPLGKKGPGVRGKKIKFK